MKRIVVFLMIVMVISVVHIPPKQDFSDAEHVCFVCDQPCHEEGVENIQNGNDFYVRVEGKDATRVCVKLSNIKGIVYHYKGLSADQVKAKFLDFKFGETYFDDMVVVTGYTKKYSDFRIIDNKRVNVQIAVKQDEIIVGLPLILTGF